MMLYAYFDGSGIIVEGYNNDDELVYYDYLSYEDILTIMADLMQRNDFTEDDVAKFSYNTLLPVLNGRHKGAWDSVYKIMHEHSQQSVR